ncbi:hypothetical protein METHP14_400009 [Pseudomonas sp. P14-2025]
MVLRSTTVFKTVVQASNPCSFSDVIDSKKGRNGTATDRFAQTCPQGKLRFWLGYEFNFFLARFEPEEA